MLELARAPTELKLTRKTLLRASEPSVAQLSVEQRNMTLAARAFER